MNEVLSSELKIQEKKIYISTRSPEQKFDIAIEEEIFTSDEGKHCHVVFDDLFEKKAEDIFLKFTRGKHEKIDV